MSELDVAVLLVIGLIAKEMTEFFKRSTWAPRWLLPVICTILSSSIAAFYEIGKQYGTGFEHPENIVLAWGLGFVAGLAGVGVNEFSKVGEYRQQEQVITRIMERNRPELEKIREEYVADGRRVRRGPDGRFISRKEAEDVRAEG